MHQLKKSNTSKEVKALLTPEENKRLRQLGNCGFMKGMQVRYVGNLDDVDRYSGALIVDEIKSTALNY